MAIHRLNYSGSFAWWCGTITPASRWNFSLLILPLDPDAAALEIAAHDTQTANQDVLPDIKIPCSSYVVQDSSPVLRFTRSRSQQHRASLLISSSVSSLAVISLNFRPQYQYTLKSIHTSLRLLCVFWNLPLSQFALRYVRLKDSSTSTERWPYKMRRHQD